MQLRPMWPRPRILPCILDELKVNSKAGNREEPMIRTTLTAGALIASVLPATAVEVDLEIHKLCLEAKDYVGCVRAMTGDTSNRVTTSQGADITEGNQCPSGFAYIGGGNCQEVRCYGGSGLGHDQRVAGRKDTKGRDIWGCKWGGELRVLGAVVRASNNPECPEGQPKLGFNSTCQTTRETEED